MHNELTDSQKQTIDTLHDLGHTPAEIHRALGIPSSTVSHVLKRIEERGTTANKKSPGRPRKSNERDDRILIRKSHSSPKMTLRELKYQADSNLSIATIRRRLHEVNNVKWRLGDRPRLTKEQAQKRFRWAKENLSKTVDDWRKVIWSDECFVENGGDAHGWVFRRPPLEEIGKKPHKAESKNGEGMPLRIWACVANNLPGPLVPFDDVTTAKAYTDSLEKNLLPFIEKLPTDVKDGLVFQQENGRMHTAHFTNRWFTKNGISVVAWPPNSPDMNPMDEVWHELMAKLHHRMPHADVISGEPAQMREVLLERLNIVWSEIVGDVFEQLISSMPSRVEALYEAQGWYTRY